MDPESKNKCSENTEQQWREQESEMAIAFTQTQLRDYNALTNTIRKKKFLINYLNFLLIDNSDQSV
jgi:hypothetical protein